MKSPLLITLFISLCLTLSACAAPATIDNENPSAESSDESISETIELSSEIAESSYMKRILAESTLSRKLTLTADETYQIAFPFESESIHYSSDNPLIAAVSDDGVIRGKSGGKVMVHAVADELPFHILVTVDAPLNTENTAAPYAGFSLDDFDAEAAEKAVELYATQCGMAIRSGLNDTEHLVYTDLFLNTDELSACEVKYKLLTSVDYLLSKECSEMDLVISVESGEIACRFYAK